MLRSAIREDCAVSAWSRITLFLQTDILFPAISLAGAGSSRGAAAQELCSKPQEGKTVGLSDKYPSQVYQFVGGFFLGLSWVLFFCFVWGFFCYGVWE